LKNEKLKIEIENWKIRELKHFMKNDYLKIEKWKININKLINSNWKIEKLKMIIWNSKIEKWKKII
jgi:hypothetical protein